MVIRLLALHLLKERTESTFLKEEHYTRGHTYHFCWGRLLGSPLLEAPVPAPRDLSPGYLCHPSAFPSDLKRLNRKGMRLKSKLEEYFLITSTMEPSRYLLSPSQIRSLVSMS